MPLPYEVESLDGIDPKIAGEYTKSEDGKFRLGLTLPEGFKVENVTGLTSALAKERAAGKQHAERLAKLGDIDPEAAVKAFQQVQEWSKSGSPEDKLKKQLESIQAQMADAHGKEKKALLDEKAQLERDLNVAVVENDISRVCSKYGVKESVFGPILRAVTKCGSANGKRVTVVTNPDGTPRINATDVNAAFTLDMQMEELKKNPDFAALFPGAGNSGGGSTGGGAGGGSGGRPGGVVTISRADARDRQKFRAAEERAQKAGGRLEIVD